MERPIFSIITITFNSANTIERTLKSVLNQNYKDYEYIIVDGASKDSTMDIVRKYEPLFEGRMKWKSEPDNGIYNAMNKGIMRASGQIVGIVNSDDWLESDALSHIYEKFSEKNEDLNTLYCGGIKYHYPEEIKVWPSNIKKFKAQALLYEMAGIRHPAVFVPKSIYDNIGIFDEDMKITADADFILRCYDAKYEFCQVDYIISNMSDGGASTNGSNKTEQLRRKDRRIMLKKRNFNWCRYQFLYYSWLMRNKLRSLLVKLNFYK